MRYAITIIEQIRFAQIVPTKALPPAATTTTTACAHDATSTYEHDALFVEHSINDTKHGAAGAQNSFLTQSHVLFECTISAVRAHAHASASDDPAQSAK